MERKEIKVWGPGVTHGNGLNGKSHPAFSEGPDAPGSTIGIISNDWLRSASCQSGREVVTRSKAY